MFRTPGSREGRKRSVAPFSNIRLGTVAATTLGGATTDAPAGNVLTGLVQSCAGVSSIRYKPLQKLIGTTWTTITG